MSVKSSYLVRNPYIRLWGGTLFLCYLLTCKIGLPHRPDAEKNCYGFIQIDHCSNTDLYCDDTNQLTDLC